MSNEVVNTQAPTQPEEDSQCAGLFERNGTQVRCSHKGKMQEGGRWYCRHHALSMAGVKAERKKSREEQKEVKKIRSIQEVVESVLKEEGVFLAPIRQTALAAALIKAVEKIK